MIRRTQSFSCDFERILDINQQSSIDKVKDNEKMKDALKNDKNVVLAAV